MSVQTSDNIGGTADALRVPAGGPEAGDGGATAEVNAASQPDRNAGQPKGKPGPEASGEGKSQTTSLQKAFESGPEAGDGGVTGGGNAEAGQPDRTAGQPKGKLDSSKSNDLPQWAMQLNKKLQAESAVAAELSAFKSLDDFVKAYLDAKAEPATTGRPESAAGYGFAKSDPAFAGLAFETGLTGSQAETLYEAALAQAEAARSAAMEAQERDFASAEAMLRKEHGERYGEAVALMVRGLGNNPATGEPSPVARLLLEAGLAGRPEIVRAFIELGRATSESSAHGGSRQAGLPDSVTQGRGFSYRD